MPIIKEPRPLPSDLNYVPPGTKPHEVSSRENWWALAERHEVKASGLTANDLCYVNFKTRNPPEINWYLYHKIGCRTATADGKEFSLLDRRHAGDRLSPDGRPASAGRQDQTRKPGDANEHLGWRRGATPEPRSSWPASTP
jgi:hypothetical protein